MIRNINPSHVSSDEGYELRVVGFPPELEYSDGDYKLRIQIDSTLRRGPKPVGLIYFSDAKKWEPPHHLEVIELETREKLRLRLVDLLECMGGLFSIE